MDFNKKMFLKSLLTCISFGVQASFVDVCLETGRLASTISAGADLIDLSLFPEIRGMVSHTMSNSIKKTAIDLKDDKAFKATVLGSYIAYKVNP